MIVVDRSYGFLADPQINTLQLQIPRRSSSDFSGLEPLFKKLFNLMSY